MQPEESKRINEKFRLGAIEFLANTRDLDRDFLEMLSVDALIKILDMPK